MSERWRTFVRDAGIPLRPPVLTYPHTHGLPKRLDAFSPEGAQPGADYETLREQLLDPFGIEKVILSYDIGHEPGHANVYLNVDLARAMNDWSVDTWLSRDNRLYSAVAVANQLPEEAAAEIRRIGAHPRMVEVLLCLDGLGLPFGHPVYHPIFEAAQELDLPVAIHLGGESSRASHVAAGGPPSFRFEYHALGNQCLLHYLTSLITHGVFEKFPRLKIILAEAGLCWLPWLAWGLDSNYKNLRRESPWVRRLPSEYIRQHVRLTTQPLELTERRVQLIELLEAFGDVDEMLLFSSDYPHWDADDVGYIASRLPEAWLPRVFYGNAAELFGSRDTEDRVAGSTR